jgi:hypothetical protein
MRLYLPEECGKDGYPFAWHGSPGHWVALNSAEAGEPLRLGGIKDCVREQAAHRCVRCGHPYIKGAGEWSPCDACCTHGAPLRVVTPEGDVLGEDPRAPWADVRVPEVRAAYPECTVEAAWRILTVHHLNGDKADCRWWNLAALDQRCHLQIQGRVRMERVWPWEHSEWFRPYVAGYYAWAYLGQELTREQTEARLDELLALERAA